MASTTSRPKPVGYEPPVLRVLGTAHELTQGPVGGANPDGTFPLHSSR